MARILPSVVVALLAVSVVGCTSEPSPSVGEASTTPLVSSAPVGPSADVEVRVVPGALQGFLTAGRQAMVVEEVGAAVDRWVEDAWVAGPWPRTVAGVWGSFTRDGARAASRDAWVTSAAGHSERIRAVRVARRDVTVDLFARQGTPHGATARVALSFDVTPIEAVDGDTRKVVMRGRVFLTPVPDGWKIFGHDLTRGGW